MSIIDSEEIALVNKFLHDAVRVLALCFLGSVSHLECSYHFDISEWIELSLGKRLNLNLLLLFIFLLIPVGIIRAEQVHEKHFCKLTSSAEFIEIS